MLAATGIAGLLYAPVFGLAALLVPVVLVLAAAYGVFEAARARPPLERWQLPLTAAAALVVLLLTVLRSTTLAGLPTGETVGVLADGVTDSWRLALQTTWPAGDDPRVLLFAPLLVTLAALLGTEALRHDRRGLALLPSAAVGVLAQAYSATTGWTAAVVALGWAAAAAVVLGSPTRDATTTVLSRSTRAVQAARTAAGAALPTAAAALLLALVFASGSLAGRPPMELPREPPAQLAGAVSNPLDEIAERLALPDTEVFRVRTSAEVDRWQLVVLDRFDGDTWTPGAEYLRLGGDLPATGPRRGEATVSVTDLSPPWLPSQRGTTSVSGVRPLVDQTTGTLVAPAPVQGEYGVTWAAPALTADEARGRAIDPDALGAPLQDVPAGISDLAESAVGDRGASVGTALVLADYLRERFPLATGARVPTGHGWEQLQRFLLGGGAGTSEQFATAYAVLARVLGIPARVVVGYRQPAEREPDGSYVVRNGDIFAWPEVAVQGGAWVAVDPLPERSGAAPPPPLPPPPAGRPRPTAPPPAQAEPDPPAADENEQEPGESPAERLWLPVVGAVGVALPLGWLLGVPVAKAVRRRRRRHRDGQEAVVGAWLEARDQLRSYGVPASRAMTVRDLARAGPGQDGLHRLAGAVDAAVWSGAGGRPELADEAWDAVDDVRRDLHESPPARRVRAALEVRSLFPPR